MSDRSKKINSLLKYWGRIVLRMTDIRIETRRDLPYEVRCALDNEYDRLRKIVLRLSRLKTNVTPNQIFV